jgi:hypothetical protein
MDQNPGLSTPAPLGLYQQPTPRLPDHGVRQTNAQSTIALFRPERGPLRAYPLDLDNLPPPPPPLPAGVYQTYPYTIIIIIVPGRRIDDRIIIGMPDTHSPIPIIKPHVEVVPKS